MNRLTVVPLDISALRQGLLAAARSGFSQLTVNEVWNKLRTWVGTPGPQRASVSWASHPQGMSTCTPNDVPGRRRRVLKWDERRIGRGHDPVHLCRILRRRRHGPRGARRDSWRCLFANDFDRKKVSTYEANWGAGDIRRADVASLTLADLPGTVVDLAWASFPCQDLSLAGSYRGLGRERDNAPTRSGTFWPFWNLMRGLVARRPRSANDRSGKRLWMFDVPRRKRLCRNRIGARGLRVQIWSRGHQRLSFCSSVTAARFFHRRPEGRGDPRFACRARA